MLNRVSKSFLLVCRYDYENVASEGAEAMMESLRAGPAQPGDDLGSGFELKGRGVCDYARTSVVLLCCTVVDGARMILVPRQVFYE